MEFVALYLQLVEAHFVGSVFDVFCWVGRLPTLIVVGVDTLRSDLRPHAIEWTSNMQKNPSWYKHGGFQFWKPCPFCPKDLGNEPLHKMEKSTLGCGKQFKLPAFGSRSHISQKIFGSLPYDIRYIRGAKETGMMYFWRTTESSKSQGSFFFACLTAHLLV